MLITPCRLTEMQSINVFRAGQCADKPGTYFDMALTYTDLPSDFHDPAVHGTHPAVFVLGKFHRLLQFLEIEVLANKLINEMHGMKTDGLSSVRSPFRRL